MKKPTQARLLLVDDDRSLREMLRMELDDAGFEVLTASDVAAAKALAHQHHFDYALVDFRLPDGNGQSVVEEIAREQPDTVVVMMSAERSAQRTRAALRAGARAFFDKPIPMDQLFRTLQPPAA